MYSIIFSVNFRFLNTYLSNDRIFALELRSPVDSIYQWRLAKEVPFKYRLLFSEIVFLTWYLLRNNDYDNAAFKTAYRLWSYILFVAAGISFYFLLIVLGFEKNWAFVGSLIYLFLPPLLLAFKYPVHTKEDLLGYVFLNVGLIAFLKKNDFALLCISIIAVLCRETLLVISFIYLFYSESSMTKRILFALVPIAIAILIRVYKGFEMYDVLGMGLLRNLEFFSQSFAFTFMSFNVFWLLFFYSQIYQSQDGTRQQKLLLRMSLPIVALIYVTAFLGGRIMELRLIYLAAPWIIVSALILLHEKYETLKECVRSKLFHLLNGAGLLVLAMMFITIREVRPQTFDMMHSVWWIVLFVGCQLTIMGMVFIKFMQEHKS